MGTGVVQGIIFGDVLASSHPNFRGIKAVQVNRATAISRLPMVLQSRYSSYR